jgi:hypothetical protein
VAGTVLTDVDCRGVVADRRHDELHPTNVIVDATRKAGEKTNEVVQDLTEIA